MTLTVVSYDAMERQRRRQEKERIRKAHARYKWVLDTRKSHHEDRRFVGWDGEGPRDAGYALFGNSDGDEICRPFLPTIECLDLLLEHKEKHPNTIDVWFGGDYDASNILCDLPRRNMAALHEYGRTIWGDYQIEHIPHKIFKVRRGEIAVTIFDIHSFFDSGYYDALVSWDIGTHEQREKIKIGKENRADFAWADIADIRDYFRLELLLMPELCDKLRDTFADAGYVPRSWHGPGALARMALHRHKVFDAMAGSPNTVSRAARSAFAAGRFELKWAGHFQGRIWNYDIHSAYPYFATSLPNLAKGTWRRTRVFEPGKFAIYRIRYEANEPDAFRLYPLFRRLPNSGVAWPYRVTGWYWSPEAQLVSGDPDAKILEGWVFDELDEKDRPFAWLAEYYLRRQRLKDNGQAAEYTFKLIINAVYGQLAQRVGWDRKNGKSPRTHQLEWAGYITSCCRAAVYKAALASGEKLISIDTDGLYSMAPIEGLDIGENLGQWECTEYSDGIFWQSGVYVLKEALDYDESYNNWKKARSRGIPKGTYSAEDLLDAVKTRKTLRVKKNRFMGYRQADNNQWDKWNTWSEDEIELVFGGGGKRSHIGRFGGCNSLCHDEVHALGALQVMYGPSGNPESKPHYLPWLDNEKLMTQVKEKGWFVLNMEDPDSEEIGWVKASRLSQSTQMESSSQNFLSFRSTKNEESHASVAGHGTKLRAKLVSLFSSPTE
jgi:hypothetical protein